ncbi:hypothetical protein N658DRAFT_498714 [Parathielavia hyrcaniae]|uniref:Uncharacterized protein n=1 Tax=Parathielavia hyrcaniae TaxID=113614 RepID=A0AAN6PW98_9PEZI|nr:hypothetical protein N658DRAFT_498714 [Parathielavia hyrcaniae]
MAANSARYPRPSPDLRVDSVSGLVVKSIVAIDGPRVRFAADAEDLFLPAGATES